jgi:hypothetical protein
MSVFALCDYEGEVQVGDKTRFDASKSFYAKNDTALTAVTVNPGYGTTAISVYDATDQNAWFLDWCFDSFKIDVVTGINDKLLWSIDGTNVITTTLTEAAYPYADYVDHVATKMSIDSALPIGYDDSYNGDLRIVQINIASGTFEFYDSPVATQLFMPLDVMAASQTGKQIQWGMRQVTVTVSNAAGANSSSVSVYPKVYSADGDRLFCADVDLVSHEPDILKWVSPGRNSYKNVYRRAQKLILQWLDEQGYIDVYGNKYDKFDIIDMDGVRDWSAYMSLKLIYQGIQNQVDDVFSQKAKTYAALEAIARNRVILRLDTNEDGEVDATEGLNISSGSLYRR